MSSKFHTEGHQLWLKNVDHQSKKKVKWANFGALLPWKICNFIKNSKNTILFLFTKESKNMVFIAEKNHLRGVTKGGYPRTPVNNANLIICDYHCDDINCHHIEIGNRLLNPISCI